MDYPLLFDIVMLFILCIILILVITQHKIPKNSNLVTLFICVIAIVLLGFAPPTEEIGTDRPVYAKMFLYVDDYLRSGFRDIGFIYFVKLCNILTNNIIGAFVISAILYVFATYYFYRKSNSNKYLYMILLSFLALGYTNHQYNVLRSGLALSFLLIAFSKDQKRIITILFSFIAVFFHVSALIVIIGYFITTKCQNTKVLYMFWGAMLMALFIGVFDSLEQFVGIFQSVEVQRLTYYLSSGDLGYKTGLRLDFIGYSLFPILMGWFYLFKKNFQDKYYTHIYNTYLFCNACWLSFSKMPFNDRFAYLSWVFIPFILLYPILVTDKKNESIKHKKILMLTSIFAIVGLNIFIKYIR